MTSIAGQIASQRLNRVKVAPGAPNPNTGLDFGNLLRGWGSVGHDLARPFTQFYKHPGLRTGIGAAAMFPIGLKGTVMPKRWDVAADPARGHIDAVSRPGNPPSMDVNEMTAHMPGKGEVGNATIYQHPRESEIGQVWKDETVGGGLGMFYALVAPAVNRYRTEGIPISANITNPKLARLVLLMGEKNPGMFTKATLDNAHATHLGRHDYVTTPPPPTHTSASYFIQNGRGGRRPFTVAEQQAWDRSHGR